jgi:hypothetical protein
MASGAGEGVPAGPRGADHFSDIIVALEACLVGNPVIPRSDDDVIRKSAGGEGQGVIHAVEGFGEVLREESGRGVAVVTDRDCMMGRPSPAFELLAHDVAVGAGGRIVRHVGGSARVSEGVNANPKKEADRETEQDGGDAALFLNQIRVYLIVTPESGMLHALRGHFQSAPAGDRRWSALLPVESRSRPAATSGYARSAGSEP